MDSYSLPKLSFRYRPRDGGIRTVIYGRRCTDGGIRTAVYGRRYTNGGIRTPSEKRQGAKQLDLKHEIWKLKLWLYSSQWLLLFYYYYYYLSPYVRYLQLHTSKNHVSMLYSFAAILYLQFMVPVTLRSMWNLWLISSSSSSSWSHSSFAGFHVVRANKPALLIHYPARNVTTICHVLRASAFCIRIHRSGRRLNIFNSRVIYLG